MSLRARLAEATRDLAAERITDLRLQRLPKGDRAGREEGEIDSEAMMVVRKLSKGGLALRCAGKRGRYSPPSRIMQLSHTRMLGLEV